MHPFKGKNKKIGFRKLITLENLKTLTQSPQNIDHLINEATDKINSFIRVKLFVVFLPIGFISFYFHAGIGLAFIALALFGLFSLQLFLEAIFVGFFTLLFFIIFNSWMTSISIMVFFWALYNIYDFTQKTKNANQGVKVDPTKKSKNDQDNCE